MQTAPVEPLGDADRAAADRVLADAFAQYPVMRWVLGADAATPDRVHALVALFTAGRWLRAHPVWGVRAPDRALAGVVTLTPPGDHPTPAAFSEHAERAWASLGADARARYDALREVWGALSPHGPRWHVNMLGVASAFRGGGYGACLLRDVLARAERDPYALGVDLTTEDARNVPFYVAHGFEVTAHGRIDDALETWILVRHHAGR